MYSIYGYWIQPNEADERMFHVRALVDKRGIISWADLCTSRQSVPRAYGHCRCYIYFECGPKITINFPASSQSTFEMLISHVNSLNESPNQFTLNHQSPTFHAIHIVLRTYNHIACNFLCVAEREKKENRNKNKYKTSPPSPSFQRHFFPLYVCVNPYFNLNWRRPAIFRLFLTNFIYQFVQISPH